MFHVQVLPGRDPGERCTEAFGKVREKHGEVMSVIIEYIPAKECKNEKAWYTCHKCGACGRRFVQGFMADDGGTHPQEDDE